MPSALSKSLTKIAFDEFIDGIARQHTKLQLRNHFGRRDATFDKKTFHKDASESESDKIVRNILQEQPETVTIRRVTGNSEELFAVTFEAPDDVTIGELLAAIEADQGVVVDGKKARLCLFKSSESDLIFVNRVVLPEPPKEPKPRTISRTGRQLRAKPKTRTRKG